MKKYIHISVLCLSVLLLLSACQLDNNPAPTPTIAPLTDSGDQVAQGDALPTPTAVAASGNDDSGVSQPQPEGEGGETAATGDAYPAPYPAPGEGTPEAEESPTAEASPDAPSDEPSPTSTGEEAPEATETAEATPEASPDATTEPTAAPTTVPVTPGTTIQHTVTEGEWLLQISRCYGTSYAAVLQANRNIANPNRILPGWQVTVPNAGSQGAIIGPPCVLPYVVQPGDTFGALAQRYGTTAAILQLANPGPLLAGETIFVPNIAAEPTPTATPAP